MTDIDTKPLRELLALIKTTTGDYEFKALEEHEAYEFAAAVPALLDAADDLKLARVVAGMGNATLKMVQEDRDRLKADLAVRDENYGTLLQRWKDACQDVAILRAENQRLADDPKAY